MKVMIVGPVFPYRGGIAHYTTLLTRALERHNHSVQVVSFRRQYPGWLYPGKTDKDTSTQPLLVSASYPLDPLYPWTWITTVQSIQSQSPELVLIQWWTTFWAPALSLIAFLLRRKNILVAFDIHNVIPHEARPWDVWLARMALHQGQAFIVHAPHQKDRLVSIISDANIKSVPIPAFPRFSQQNITKAEARLRLNLHTELPILLFFGIVRPYKGLKYLIDAQACLRERGRPVFLVVAGEFWEDKNIYLEQIDKLNLAELVRIEDRYVPNEEADLLFCASDVLVAPYTGGTQSAVARLAMGYGLPTIVTDKIAADLLVENQGHMKVVPAGHVHALAEAIETLLTNPPQPWLTNVRYPDEWQHLIEVLKDISQMGIHMDQSPWNVA
jgi:glycosyltransferase involved in cell wall biosynthesis